nr:MOP flippase family protein [uncultured Fluviicola sp.]
MNLKQQAFSGVKWTTLSALVNILVQLVQLVILTQLLSRQDFGLMAIVMVVIGFSQLFIDMGVSNAIIYKKEISYKELSSLYWFNIVVGCTFFLLLVFSSWSIARFYDNNRLSSLVQLVAISFVIQPWGQQFMIFLQKELKFKILAQVEIISKFVSFSSVIILAYLDYGVYSLALGTPVYALCSAVGYNIVGRRYYQPKLFFSFQKVKTYLNFGLFQMGDKFLNYFALQMDTILIGKIMGIEILGVYNIAKDLTSKPYMIINPIITRVTFPVMSKINHDIPKLKLIFLQTLNYLSYINILIYLLIILLAEPIVLVLFGSKWVDAIPLIQILALTYVFRSFGNPSGSLLLSLGAAKQAFIWNLLVFILYPVSIFSGSYWGLIGIAIGTCILQVVLFIPNWKMNVQPFINVSFSEYLAVYAKPFLLPLIASLPCYLLLMFMQPTIWSMLITSILFTVLFLSLALKFEKYLVIDAVEFLPDKLKQSKALVKLKNKGD